jgi:hypothetical protein
MMTFWLLSRAAPYEYRSLIPVGATWRRDFNAGRGSADGGRICRRRPVLDALGERLLIAAKTDLIVVLWLAIAISDVARRRFFSPLDIMGSSEATGSRQIRNASAFLQNTLEQVAVAVPAHFALAAFYPGSPAIVPALGGLFSLGRLLFWIGYPRGPVARAFGFAISFYPSIGALIVCGFALLTR